MLKEVVKHLRKQYKGCGCEWYRWPGRGQEHWLNRKEQTTEEREDWDLNSTKKNLFGWNNSPEKLAHILLACLLKTKN